MGKKTAAQKKAAVTRKANARAARLASQGAYQSPDVISYTGQTRGRIEGDECSVHSFDFGLNASNANSVEAKIAKIWTEQSGQIVVSCQGACPPAADVLKAAGLGSSATDYVIVAARRLMDHAISIDPDRPNVHIFGEDNLGTAKKPKKLLSENERLTRVVEAVATGVGQAHMRGHNVLEMFTDTLLPASAAFVRRHVTWDGKENGTVFELDGAFVLTRFTLKSGQRPKFGCRTPSAKTARHSLKLAYDGLLPDADGGVLALQSKAIGLSGLASTARLSVVKSGSGLYYQRIECGNELLRQGFEDGVRIRGWGHMVPNPDLIKNPPNTLPWDPNRANWWRVQPVTVFRYDSDQAVAEIHFAIFKGRNAGMEDLPIHGQGLPGSVVDAIEAVTGSTTIRADMPHGEFRTLMLGALDRAATQWQSSVNSSLGLWANRQQMIFTNANPPGHWNIDTHPEILIVGSHQASLLREILKQRNVID